MEKIERCKGMKEVAGDIYRCNRPAFHNGYCGKWEKVGETDDKQQEMRHSDVDLSRVQQTMLKQIQVQNPLFFSDYGIQVLLSEGRDTLRLHTKNNGVVVNVEIELTPMDTYEIQGWLITSNGKDAELLEETEILFTHLDSTIRDILEKGQRQ